MKKITVLILVLALAVPVQAWHLFPVGKEIVEVQKTNYKLTVACTAVTAILGVIIGICIHHQDAIEKGMQAAEISRLNGIIEDDKSERAHLMTEITGKETKIAELNHKNEDFRGRIQSLERDTSVLQSKYDSKNSDWYKLNTHITQLEGTITGLQHDVGALRQTVADKDKVIEELTNRKG
jgi:peptidoglycan hydrolase CwlO-like protein